MLVSWFGCKLECSRSPLPLEVQEGVKYLTCKGDIVPRSAKRGHLRVATATAFSAALGVDLSALTGTFCLCESGLGAYMAWPDESTLFS